jgi:hypothetical protein
MDSQCTRAARPGSMTCVMQVSDLAASADGTYHARTLSEDRMEADQSLVRIRSVGRIVLWVVLAILAAAASYALWIALKNWSHIGV